MTLFVSYIVRRDFFARFLFYVLEVSAISTKELQINEEIRAKEVRIIGDDGEQIGVVATSKALEMAYDRDLDLVLMAPNAEPPVCRIMDYGKYRFERDKREKEAKKKQTTVEDKEIQLSCRIDTHDFETKVKHAHRFLGDGNKVRVVVKFRGREMSHLDLGREMLEKFEQACSGIGSVDKRPALEGRFMSMIVNPVKQPAK
ncbi:MAG: translation initiation factor IF-3 [Clostridia bacterium]|nr:translation initiation factor IF-3 [Clostridia bacterium]